MVAEVIEKRITLTRGGRALVRTMAAHGAHTCLVSGGFTLFTGPIAAAIGFAENRGNRLEVHDGRFTGRVLPPILGREAKLATLLELRAALGPRKERNAGGRRRRQRPPDDPEGGLGVAYHAKPVVAAAAGARIDHGDLTALLYAQGYTRSEISE